MSSTCLLLLLSVIVLSASLASPYSAEPFTVIGVSPSTLSDDAPLPLSLPSLNVTSSPSPLSSSPLSSPSSLLLAPVTVTSVSGCLVQSGQTSQQCNFSSPITVRGSGFTAPSVISLNERINCTFVTVLSSTQLLFYPACGVYWTRGQPYSLSVFANGTHSNLLPLALTFANTDPVLTAVTGCPASAPCFIGQNTWRLTVSGSNFLEVPNFLFLVIGNETRLMAWPDFALRSFTFTSFIAEFSPISAVLWTQLFGAPLDPTKAVPVIIQVDPPQGAVVQSPILRNAVYLNADPNWRPPAPSSSSSTGPAPALPPTISAVVGCADFPSTGTTTECPYNSAALYLTVFGSNFHTASITFIRLGNDTACRNPTRDHPSRLSCLLPAIAPTVAGALTLFVNTSAGLLSIPQAVSFSPTFTAPTVQMVSGCSTVGQGQSTRDCTRDNTLTITGSFFPRYLSDVVARLGGTIEVKCLWLELPEPSVVCPLYSVSMEQLFKGPNVPVLVKLRFGTDRWSDEVQGFTILYAPPPPQSTGGGGGNGGNGADVAGDDDLDAMKIALMVLMVISLSILTLATLVWGVTWWSAQRRAYVSRNGAAAVDMRQVLLH